MAGGGIEIWVQGFVHSLEQGFLARIIKVAAFSVALIALSALYLFVNFKGLSEKEGMEQGQIAKSLASGDGFSTKVIRPLAFWQLQKNNKGIAKINFPDTYHAPLNAMVNAAPLRLVRSQWAMAPSEVIYMPDRVIAAVSVGLFMFSILINYFLAKMLFDRKIAVLGCGLLVLCDLFWKFSLSGLPTMLLLAIFSIANFLIVLAMRAEQSGRAVGVWLAFAGAFYGFMALTHPLAVWAFGGALIFITVYFRPRVLSALLVLGFFLVVVSPWLARNYMVSGNPFGVGIYAALDGVRGSEAQWMRSLDPALDGLSPRLFRSKIETNLLGQFNNIFSYFGWNLMAPMFFVSLIHLFKLQVRSSFRWYLLLSWMGAALGMCIFSPHGAVSFNQIHIIFMPLMSFYGLAFVLVMWSRLPIDYRAVRIAFITLIFLISAIPMLFQLLPGGNKGRLQWPPYVPPFIGILASWYEPQEIIASDMPWGVGWYANRKSLWIPTTPQEMIEMHDYGVLGTGITGLYMTPVTGHKGLHNAILNGEYQQWAQIILRAGLPTGFPLTALVPLPIDNQCLLIADRERWRTDDVAAAAADNPATAEDDEEAAEPAPE